MSDPTHQDSPPPSGERNIELLAGGSQEPSFAIPELNVSKLVGEVAAGSVMATPITPDHRLRYAMQTIVEIGAVASVLEVVDTGDEDDPTAVEPVNPYADLADPKLRKQVANREQYLAGHFTAGGQEYARTPFLDHAEVHAQSVTLLEEQNHPSIAFLTALALTPGIPPAIRQDLAQDVVTVSLGWKAQRALHEKRLAVVKQVLKSSPKILWLGL